jgi:hypothetical protein
MANIVAGIFGSMIFFYGAWLILWVSFKIGGFLLNMPVQEVPDDPNRSWIGQQVAACCPTFYRWFS